jgi:hypothetical protein
MLSAIQVQTSSVVLSFRPIQVSPVHSAWTASSWVESSMVARVADLATHAVVASAKVALLDVST